MPRVLVLVAGLPNGILGPLIGRLKKGNADLDVIQTLPLESAGYTAEYAEYLYRMVCSTLREVVGSDRSDLWSVNFVVLYLSKKDGSDYYIVKRFDIEALLVPMVMKKPRAKAPKRHEAHIAINELVLQSNQMLRNARMILRSLAQEVTNRDTRTCVLLPQANFGAQFDIVKRCVHGAVLTCTSNTAFDNRLRAVAAQLPKNSEGRFQSGRLVFRAPSKAGARHGIAPLWGANGHNDRCVVRGRVRFGVPYDPKFHYDCKLVTNSHRRFTSCHGEKELKRGRSHVNIAPNDNIR